MSMLGKIHHRESSASFLRNGASALSLALFVLAAAGPAQAGGKITTFDVPNSTTTFARSIGSDGSIAGYYAGSAGPDQVFVRAPD